MKRKHWILLLLFLPALLGSVTMYARTRTGPNGRITAEEPLQVSYEIHWTREQWEESPFLQALTGPDVETMPVHAPSLTTWLEAQDLKPHRLRGIWGTTRQHYGALVTELYLHMSLVDHHAFFRRLHELLPADSFDVASRDHLRAYPLRRSNKGLVIYEMIVTNLETRKLRLRRDSFIRLHLGQANVRLASWSPHFTLSTTTLRLGAPLWLVTFVLLALPVPLIYLLRRPMAQLARVWMQAFSSR